MIELESAGEETRIDERSSLTDCANWLKIERHDVENSVEKCPEICAPTRVATLQTFPRILIAFRQVTSDRYSNFNFHCSHKFPVMSKDKSFRCRRGNYFLKCAINLMRGMSSTLTMIIKWIIKLMMAHEMPKRFCLLKKVRERHEIANFIASPQSSFLTHPSE